MRGENDGVRELTLYLLAGATICAERNAIPTAVVSRLCVDSGASLNQIRQWAIEILSPVR